MSQLSQNISSEFSFEEQTSYLFPHIVTADDVINNFFNQMVQYIIEDLYIIEIDKPLNTVPSQTSKISFKEVSVEDLKQARAYSAHEEYILFTEDGLTPRLGQIEEPSSTTSSHQDPLLEEKRLVKIIFTNGNSYEGFIAKRTMNGPGKYFWANGTIFEGNFIDGFPTGTGTIILPDLSWYKGEFNQGLFQGTGFLSVASVPTFYYGHWYHGMREGDGWLLYEPGDWYEGSWIKDLKHGHGQRYYKNGCKYFGYWAQGKYDGNGAMIWSNNDYYQGEWRRGAMDGYGEYIWKAFYNGTFTYSLQNWYKGQWVEGKRDGTGTMFFGGSSGAKLNGTWEKDFKHGQGDLSAGNGLRLIQDLLFDSDKLMSTDCIAIPPPIFAVPEHIDVSFYIKKMLESLRDVEEEVLEKVKALEEKSVEYAIINFLVPLNQLYERYCKLTAPVKHPVVMIRLFLWQFYQDIELSSKGISLAGSDLILFDNPASCLNSPHDPFEPIYFWQFLMSLIGVALATTSLEDELDVPRGTRISNFILCKFFDEVLDILRPKLPSLINLDLAPITSIYSLYKELGEPHSARVFLRRTCLKKNQRPISCVLELTKPKITVPKGINIFPISDHLIFQDETFETDNWSLRSHWFNLQDFWRLGARNVLNCLIKTCPLIVSDGLVTNIDYPLIFLEFYEVLIACATLVLELELGKEKQEFIEMYHLTLPRKEEALDKKEGTTPRSSTKGKKSKEKKKKANK